METNAQDDGVKLTGFFREAGGYEATDEHSYSMLTRVNIGAGAETTDR